MELKQWFDYGITLGLLMLFLSWFHRSVWVPFRDDWLKKEADERTIRKKRDKLHTKILLQVNKTTKLIDQNIGALVKLWQAKMEPHSEPPRETAPRGPREGHPPS